MVIGMALAVAAGLLVGLQNIFNSRVQTAAGQPATTALVLGLGALASFLLGLLFTGGSMFSWDALEWWHPLLGFAGVGVVICVVQAVKRLGPTVAVSIIMVSQLGFAVLWDALGVFGLEQSPPSWNQAAGLLMIAGGILVFKISPKKGITSSKQPGRMSWQHDSAEERRKKA
ncbi:DMT family transporter [Alkalicoccus urumqiensis]|uniref:DMT family transporter n=1 Tax=Alkalicoccus urumqiensis TaxID=1548213 RepID=A0A2P6MIY8_ALKUR|nr:DMT family transporter [Alkalicoccus urumqiensis]PRO66245.1 hypothetical protein C6I21_05435 [Alkalicoccus urumqiensis]